MKGRLLVAAAAALFGTLPLVAQSNDDGWFWKDKLEIRGNYRDSREAKFELKFPFSPIMLPVGQTHGFEETVDAGQHLELSVVDLHLDLGYRNLFLAHAKIRGIDKYKQNPTSTDRKIDADELYLRFGVKPENLDRPSGTSIFLQAGKAPKMERQQFRLLESYGLAATSFNRLEDVQVMVGGTAGRSLYWRYQISTGNPFFFRDSNALAGDNGIAALMQPNPDPRLKSGFPILYNTKVDSVFLETNHIQTGEGLGYRWQREDQSAGFDLLLFHYMRKMIDEEHLYGTFYGGDIDFLLGPGGFNLPISGMKKEEYGGRLYSEWGHLTTIAQFTKQSVAGLQRQGWELETGYEIPLTFGPTIRGHQLFPTIQPALRASGLNNRFRGPREYPAPSVWWDWTKFDYGVRLGIIDGTDLTVERSKHNVGSPTPLDLTETLVTLRVRM
jgi:hypothetical protein